MSPNVENSQDTPISREDQGSKQESDDEESTISALSPKPAFRAPPNRGPTYNVRRKPTYMLRQNIYYYPKSWDETMIWDREMIRLRAAGADWDEVEDMWEFLTGLRPGPKSLPKRYRQLKKKLEDYYPDPTATTSTLFPSSTISSKDARLAEAEHYYVSVKAFTISTDVAAGTSLEFATNRYHERRWPIIANYLTATGECPTSILWKAATPPGQDPLKYAREHCEAQEQSDARKQSDTQEQPEASEQSEGTVGAKWQHETTETLAVPRKSLVAKKRSEMKGKERGKKAEADGVETKRGKKRPAPEEGEVLGPFPKRKPGAKK